MSRAIGIIKRVRVKILGLKMAVNVKVKKKRWNMK